MDTKCFAQGRTFTGPENLLTLTSTLVIGRTTQILYEVHGQTIWRKKSQEILDKISSLLY